MKVRPFAEVLSTYRLRVNGLAEEYNTMESKWMHLRSVLMDDRILPDLNKTVHSVIPSLLNELNRQLVRCEDISRSSLGSRLNLDRDHEMRITSDLLFLAARFLSYMRSAFHQRTVSLEIPYIIAGLPVSPEARWGDELYLIAADNLIKNYADHLNLHGFPWTGFTSYAHMHPHYERFPGASYSNFKLMFHIALSSEMKYFLNGFLVLSHELGHASVECLAVKTEKGLVPAIMYELYWILYQVRRWAYLYLISNHGKSERCRECPFMEDLCGLAYSRGKFKDFINVIWNNPLNGLLYEMASDIIGLTISGPHYPRALFDYAFRSIVSWDGKKPKLDYEFERIFARISACYYFARARGFRWTQTCRGIFRGIALEAFSSIALLEDPYKKTFTRCIICLQRLGSLIGSIFAAEAESLFANTFSKGSADINASQFESRPEILERIKEGYVVCDAEPREIIHACIELMEKEYKEYPTVLFSLANNSTVSGVT